MNGLHPFTFPDLYKCVILGDRRSPGVATVTGHDRPQNWDVQQAKGTEGASSKLNGRNLGNFQVSFYLASDSDREDGSNDFTDWESFQTLIESTTNGPEPIALPIYHPDLARNGFTEVCNAGIGGLVWDDRGGATVQVKFREHRPPKAKKTAAAKAKPAAKTSSAKPAKPDPNAAAKRENEALRKKAQSP